MALIAIVLLIAMGQLSWLGPVSAGGIALLYAGMLLVRAWARPGRLRLGLLATLMLLIAAIALTAVLVIAWTSWNP